MSATTLPLVAAMLLTAAIEIAVACSVWMRVDDECCGCWLFDGVVTGLPGLLLCVVLAEGGAVSHACCCRDGEAPTHLAAEEGYLSILEFLVARGADVHAQDK
jgi:hypothetical protein